MTTALKVSGLSVSRGSFRLGPVDVEIPCGLALGLIGPNGVGKSTLLYAILGLIRRDAGDVEVLGQPARPMGGSWKQKLGVVLDGQGHYERLTVKENLRVYAGLHATWDAKLESELLERFQLPASKVAKHLSKGERQKLSLVAALSHRPKLLILDEATAGLDPVVRAIMMDVLFEAMRDDEMSILMATHLIADVATLSDSVAFMQNGCIARLSAKDELLDAWRRISFQFDGPLTGLSAVASHAREDSRHLVTTFNAEITLWELERLGAIDIEAHKMNLEEIAVQVLKGGAQ